MSVCDRFLSLNVRGLREGKKRREIFRWLKRFHCGEKSIIFLQETHSTEKDICIWEQEWGSKVLMAHGTSNSRGVAILFPMNYDFVIDNYASGENGRSIAVTISQDQVQYSLINIYAPTSDHEQEQQIFIPTEKSY